MDKNKNKEYRNEYQKHRYKDPYYRLLTRIYSQLYRLVNEISKSSKPRKGSINYLGIESREQFFTHIKERLALKHPHLSFPEDYGRGKKLEFNHINSLLTAYQTGGIEAMIAAAHYSNVELELIEVNRAAKKDRKYKSKKFKLKEDEILEVKDGLVKVKKFSFETDYTFIFDEEYPAGKTLDLIKDYQIALTGNQSCSIQFKHKESGKRVTVYQLFGIAKNLRKLSPLDYSKNSLSLGRRPVINVTTGKKYAGSSEASRDSGIHFTSILWSIKHQRPIKGQQWKRI